MPTTVFSQLAANTSQNPPGIQDPGGGGVGDVLTRQADGTFAVMPIVDRARELVAITASTATSTLDMAAHTANVFCVVTLSANHTLTLKSMTDARSVRFQTKQDATGGRTFAISNGATTQTVTLPSTAAGAVAWVDAWFDGDSIVIGPALAVTKMAALPTGGAATVLDLLFPSGQWMNTVLPSNVLIHPNSANGNYEIRRELGGKGTGDVTTGSNVITNVTTTANEFVVGQRIKGSGIPASVRITAVDTTAKTITFAGTAGASSTGAGRSISGNTPWVESTSWTAGSLSCRSPSPTCRSTTTANSSASRGRRTSPP
jgi:hypothetical protein